MKPAGRVDQNHVIAAVAGVTHALFRARDRIVIAGRIEVAEPVVAHRTRNCSTAAGR